MMKIFSCEINGVNFSAKAEEPLYPQLQTLFQLIESIPPHEIKNGYRLEAGFTTFTFVEKTGVYQIMAPDFQKNPLADVTDDLTLALWVQLEQIHLLHTYNIGGETTRFFDKIIVVKQALNESDISLQRFSNCSKGDSGWCIESVKNRGSNNANDYESYYAYQLLKLRPELIKVLALPCEYLVVFSGNNIKAILNEKNENLVK